MTPDWSVASNWENYKYLEWDTWVWWAVQLACLLWGSGRCAEGSLHGEKGFSARCIPQLSELCFRRNCCQNPTQEETVLVAIEFLFLSFWVHWCQDCFAGSPGSLKVELVQEDSLVDITVKSLINQNVKNQNDRIPDRQVKNSCISTADKI